MKKLLLSIFAFIALSVSALAQCTTSNSTGCRCKDSTQTDCDLLPDIELGQPPFHVYNDNYGIIEFSQTGNGVDDGRLKVTVSTPNTGFGPLEIRTTDVFVCGTDTFIGTAPTMCPDGISYPKISITQRIYHKNGGGVMTYYDRPAGTMTYHPTHGHMHVDNWGNYTLRTRDTSEANPLNWPIIGSGTKLAFCVEDYGTCEGYPGHCLDANGNALNTNASFPNYGLGGGMYSCSPVVQGISSGYVDIYWTDLDGMWINLPPGLCNGEYYIVCEVDPNNNFLESDENNNVYAVPFTLTKQLGNPASTPFNVQLSNTSHSLCQGESMLLTSGIIDASATYLWSNGDTTSSTNVSSTGDYTVSVSNQCGTGTSEPVHIDAFPAPSTPVAENDTISLPGSAVLTATSNGTINWYDQNLGGTSLGTGTMFNTPGINVSTTFYAEASEVHPGLSFITGLADNLVGGTGGYYNGDQSMIFDCYNAFTLHKVTVYAASAGTVNIELRNSSGVTLLSFPETVVAGMNVLTVDMPVTPGNGYMLTRTGGDLYRNNANTTSFYPINVTNYCSITGTTAGSGYYYFFYNWEIKLDDNICTSPRVPVQAVVNSPNAIADVSILNSLRVYPNPAKNNFSISFNAVEDESTIELIDNIGKIVLSRTAHANGSRVNETFDIANMSRGVYSIHILSSGKNLYSKLIIN